MKVRDLIEKLQDMPEDSDVVYWGADAEYATPENERGWYFIDLGEVHVWGGMSRLVSLSVSCGNHSDQSPLMEHPKGAAIPVLGHPVINEG